MTFYIHIAPISLNPLSFENLYIMSTIEKRMVQFGKINPT